MFDRVQKDGGDLSQLRQEKQNLYAQNGKVLRSQEEVDREIVAEELRKLHARGDYPESLRV